MSAVLVLIFWWTGVDLASGSQSVLEMLRTLTPKMIALIVALL